MPGLERVYNLTVEGEHLYRVGHDAVLVHNNCLDELSDLFEYTFDTVKGKVGFLAEVERSGDVLHLKDIVVYGAGGQKIGKGEVLKDVLRQRAYLSNKAKEMGFKRLRITGNRVESSSSANPGKVIDIEIDLN